MMKLAEFYKLERRTYYNIEIAKGLSVILFINSALIPFAIQYYISLDA